MVLMNSLVKKSVLVYAKLVVTDIAVGKTKGCMPGFKKTLNWSVSTQG
jgi:hypothetical protein